MLKNFKTRFFLFAMISSLTAGKASADARKQSRPQSLADVEFDIAQEPSPKDWQYFLRLSQPDRESIWTYYAKQGRKLHDWSWGWRLGWIRSCRENRSEFCRRRLIESLGDEAAVVRAEAATRVGETWYQKPDHIMIESLASAYQHPGNRRHDRALFVERRILYALKDIGGDKAKSVATKLSSTSSDSRKYWRSIQ